MFTSPGVNAKTIPAHIIVMPVMPQPQNLVV